MVKLVVYKISNTWHLPLSVSHPLYLLSTVTRTRQPHSKTERLRKGHCLFIETTLKRSIPWWILPQRSKLPFDRSNTSNNSANILTLICNFTRSRKCPRKAHLKKSYCWLKGMSCSEKYPNTLSKTRFWQPVRLLLLLATARSNYYPTNILVWRAR